MVLTAYMLFIVSLGQMPQLTALASYPDQASCDAAKVAVAKALEGGDEQQPLQCISIDSLEALARTNDFK